MEEIKDQAALISCIPLPEQWTNKDAFNNAKLAIMLPGERIVDSKGVVVPPIEYRQ